MDIENIKKDYSRMNEMQQKAVFCTEGPLLILAGAFVNTMFGCDLQSGFSASVACLGNVGPGFGEVGTMDNYSSMPAILKMNQTLLMMFGRLEIFGLIQLFFIRWWR